MGCPTKTVQSYSMNGCTKSTPPNLPWYYQPYPSSTLFLQKIESVYSDRSIRLDVHQLGMSKAAWNYFFKDILQKDVLEGS